MDEEKTLDEILNEPHSITFANGETIATRLNGNNYIITEDIKNLLTPSNLVHVTIDGTEYANMKLMAYQTYGNEYWFVLAEKSHDELAMEALTAKLEYLAIMTDNPEVL